MKVSKINNTTGEAFISHHKCKELLELDIPTKTTHIEYTIVGDEMHVNLSKFIKKEEPKVIVSTPSFASLTKSEQREIITKKLSSFADLKQHIG